MPSFCPILPGTSSDPAGMDRPPGSGPYYIADRVPNRRIVLERNPYYGGSRTANPDRIVWTIEPNPAARLRATERDENDFAGVFTVQDDVVRNLVDRYGLNRPGGQFLRLPSLTNYLFVFNPDRPAFRGLGQAPLRKAINYALDRQALIKAHGHWRPNQRSPATGAAQREPAGLSDRRAGSRHGTKVARAREASAAEAHPLHGELRLQRRERPRVQLESAAARHRGRCEAL